ncbi:MAG: hypothetical protein JWN75_190 [Candidatus Saccharibacteria bacterium]|nr:hypothetical protein [Candidatus Saccharibacteria bacterium]
MDFTLLKDAEGAIEATDEQQTRLDEFTQRVTSGEFHREAAGDIPYKCIDGRSCINATAGPNAAGGTESLFVADDLTVKRFASDDDSVTGGMQNIVATLHTASLPIGGHSDTGHTDPTASGCGANDKLPKIYEMIARKADVVRGFAEIILGDGSVDDQTHALIIENAQKRTDFVPGHDVLELLKRVDNAKVEQLEGMHKEVVAAINLRSGTTLDRKQLALEFGPDYQAFNVDAWSFQKAAEAISDTTEETRQKVIAMTYYNIATALVLCGRNMRVVVVK